MCRKYSVHVSTAQVRPGMQEAASLSASTSSIWLYCTFSHQFQNSEDKDLKTLRMLVHKDMKSGPETAAVIVTVRSVAPVLCWRCWDSGAYSDMADEHVKLASHWQNNVFFVTCPYSPCSSNKKSCCLIHVPTAPVVSKLSRLEGKCLLSGTDYNS